MELSNPASLDLPRFEREPSTCESCGAKFACGATLEGCWCSELSLSETTRTELSSRFQSCLCRTCLERFAASEMNCDVGVGEGTQTE